MKKMSPIIHNNPAFKEARKAFQGINATTKGSIEKSKRRHAESNSKALQSKRLNKHNDFVKKNPNKHSPYVKYEDFDN
jgi:hypothetical protein